MTEKGNDGFMMTYKEAEEYLLAIPKFTAKNSLSDTAEFYARIGKPGTESRVIHIAGTNGKGSVCAYLAAILEAGGYNVGMFTSPHLITMRERFRYNGSIAGEKEVLAAFGSVMEEIRKWNKEGKEYHPAFFEMMFFMGMIIFKDRKPDFIILETGMGGRLDATNVIEHKKLTVITKIGLDHMQYLGNTIPLIAAEKAGILAEKVPVVYLKQSEEVNAVIEARAKELQCRTCSVDCKNINILHVGNKNIDFSLKSKYYEYISLTISNAAIYQIQNISLALRAAEELEEGKTIALQQIKEAVFRTKWEGRMEEILPGIFVDGAHNEDGVEAFMESVKALGRDRNHLLFAVVQDKDYRAMIRLLMSGNLFSSVTITKVEGGRAAEPICLKNIFAEYMDVKDIHVSEDAEQAFFHSIRTKGAENRLYIAGSLYLAGLVKGLLTGQDT